MIYQNTQVIKFSIGASNTSGVTDYHIFTNHIFDFTGSALPSGMPVIVVPLGAENIATQTVTETGTYYFRAYSYNREADIYSDSYASGSITVDSISLIKNIIVSNLHMITSTGLSLLTGTFFSTFELNPSFEWTVGLETDTVNFADYNTRLTVRHPSETLFPILPILKEYILQTSGLDSGYNFNFAFDENKSIPGGPFRNYDIVVESVDAQGYTSAGNATSPQILTEAGWASNPDGFDILKVTNPPISGFYLTSGSSGVLTLNNINYNTDQYFDIHGNAYIKFSGLIFPEDIVGGRVFVSRSYFSGLDAKTGLASVKYADFQIDNQDTAIFAQTRLNTLNLKSGYLSLMLFDTFDKEYKKSNPTNFWTGLYISNTVGAAISGNISELSVSNFVEFYNNSGNNNNKNKINVISTGNNSYALVTYDNIGQEVIMFTFKE